MTPDLNPNLVAKYLHIFLQPHTMNTSRGPTPKCYNCLETSNDPQLGSKLRCKNLAKKKEKEKRKRKQKQKRRKKKDKKQKQSKVIFKFWLDNVDPSLVLLEY